MFNVAEQYMPEEDEHMVVPLPHLHWTVLRNVPSFPTQVG
jgi:hypothetical protein